MLNWCLSEPAICDRRAHTWRRQNCTFKSLEPIKTPQQDSTLAAVHTYQKTSNGAQSSYLLCAVQLKQIRQMSHTHHTPHPAQRMYDSPYTHRHPRFSHPNKQIYSTSGTSRSMRPCSYCNSRRPSSLHSPHPLPVPSRYTSCTFPSSGSGSSRGGEGRDEVLEKARRERAQREKARASRGQAVSIQRQVFSGSAATSRFGQEYGIAVFTGNMKLHRIIGVGQGVLVGAVSLMTSNTVLVSMMRSAVVLKQ